MKVNFYATYRQVVGGKTVEFPVSGEISVCQLIDQIVARFPKLRVELLDEQGKLYRHVHVFVNGRDAPYLAEGMQTILKPDDTINIFPAVAGGSE